MQAIVLGSNEKEAHKNVVDVGRLSAPIAAFLVVIVSVSTLPSPLANQVI